MSQVYSFTDLTSLQWYGDDYRSDFLTQWGFIIEHLEEDTFNMLNTQGEKTLRDLLFMQVEKSVALAEDVAHYKRVGKNHPDHAYRFLRDAIERATVNKHQKYIVEERRNAFRVGRSPLELVPDTPAVPAVPASTGRGARENKRDRKRDGSRRPGGGGSVPTPAPKSGAAPPRTTNLKDVPCYYHSAAQHITGHKGCRFGKDCHFAHDKLLSKAEFDRMERPRARSASASSTGSRKGKGKGKGDSARPPRTRTEPLHCNKFLKTGKCDYVGKNGEKCKFPHLTRAEYDAAVEKLKAQAAAAPKAAPVPP